MDRADIEERLWWLDPHQLRMGRRRSLKVYVPGLDMNFHLLSSSRRSISPAARISLAQAGMIIGWKSGADVCLREVNLAEISLMMLARRIEERRAETPVPT
jgi:hypothetical protein